MQAYRVQHKANRDRYYLLAKSPSEAVEIVTLRIADAEGRNAWSAEPDTPPFGLEKGVVLDGAGRPIKSLEA